MSRALDHSESPKSIKSENSDFSVSRSPNSNSDFGLVWICTAEFEFLDLVGFGGAALWVEPVMYSFSRYPHGVLLDALCECCTHSRAALISSLSCYSHSRAVLIACCYTCCYTSFVLSSGYTSFVLSSKSTEHTLPKAHCLIFRGHVPQTSL